jgi:hypothetical protein
MLERSTSIKNAVLKAYNHFLKQKEERKRALAHAQDGACEASQPNLKGWTLYTSFRERWIGKKDGDVKMTKTEISAHWVSKLWASVKW